MMFIPLEIEEGRLMIPYFEADSAEELWPQLVKAFHETKEASKSEEKELVVGRGGETVELLHAVLQVRNPRQRWIHPREPAINPAFALAEVIWILAGRQDSAFINHWNPKLPQFAGEGPIYHGAYGWRMRNESGIDQLQRAYEVLRSAPGSRQVVLDMWRPALDLPTSAGLPSAPDIPCNVCSLLKVRDGQLHWTQIMRSNDLILGLPHNLVQWTMVQEVLAGWLGLEVGPYTHFSDSLHVYEKNWQSVEASLSQVTPHVENIINNDFLSLPYNQFKEVLEVVEQKAQSMTKSDLRLYDLEEIAHFPDCPAAYQNILFILAADTARRRGWHVEADDLSERCLNPALRFLWSRWHERVRRLSTKEPLKFLTST